MIRRPPRSTLFPTRRSSDLTLDAYRHDLRTFLQCAADVGLTLEERDRKSTRLNSSHVKISYAVFCLKKKKKKKQTHTDNIKKATDSQLTPNNLVIVAIDSYY